MEINPSVRLPWVDRRLRFSVGRAMVKEKKSGAGLTRPLLPEEQWAFLVVCNSLCA